MRITILVLMMIVLSITNLYAQELSEPTAPAISYEFEISWGNKPNVAWTAITPVTTVVALGSVAAVHSYYGIIGNNKFEFETAISTVAVPEKATATFNIATLPSGKLYDIFRIRVRATTTYDGQTITSAWSDPSYWVMVFNLRKLNQPISVK